MMLTGHKTRSVFDRYNIVNERELLTAGETLVAYLRGRRHAPKVAPRRLRNDSVRRARPRTDELELTAPRGRHTLTRDALYQLVWSEALYRLAPRLGVTDRGLARICARHQIPVPPVGYWAKRQAGQAVASTPLPAGPDTLIVVGRRGRGGAAFGPRHSATAL